MKKNLIITIIAAVFLLQKSYSQDGKALFSGVVDSTKYSIDTVIRNVKFKNSEYLIIFAKDKYNEKQKPYTEGDIYFSPITVIIYDIVASLPVFSVKYDENEFFFFRNLENDSTKDARCFVGMLSAGGGSGYIGTIFSILINDKPKLVPLFDFSELSHLAVNLSGNEFIHIEGIWNFNENEAHFSEHRYIISTKTINGESVINKKLGKTKGKYSSFDEDMPVDEIFKKIFEKESKLLKNIDLNKFTYVF